MRIKITVITVCRNAERTIDATIKSVLNQNYKNYEYLIVDGLSTDRTLSIAEKYEEMFRGKNIPYRVISEKDRGIFDAMNKAADLAAGEWVIYMNADDTFYSSDVLDEVSSYLIEDIDVVYGNTMRIKGTDMKFAKAFPISNMSKSMPFTHQSCFTKTAVMKEYKFNLEYDVADYNFFLQIWLDKKKFYQSDITIANYSVEGYSNQDKWRTYTSTLQIKHDAGLINKDSIWQKIKNIYFRMLLKENVFGHNLAVKIWKIKYKEWRI